MVLRQWGNCETSKNFMKAFTSHIKLDKLICSLNQWTGFYRINELFVTLEFLDYLFKWKCTD